MRILLTTAALLLATVSVAHASDDIAHFGQDIVVAQGSTAGDIACAFCSVHVHGEVKGDVAVFMGSVTVDEDQNIAGDVAIFGGDLHLSPSSRVGGDVAIAAGHADTPQGTIHGSSMVLPGAVWLLFPLLPFLILAGIIWLIVYIVQRNRYSFPAYPGGQGYPPRRL